MARNKSKAIRPEMTAGEIQRRQAVIAAKRDRAPTPAQLRKRAVAELESILSTRRPYVRVESVRADDRCLGDMLLHHVELLSDKLQTKRQIQAALEVGFWVLAAAAKGNADVLGSLDSED